MPCALIFSFDNEYSWFREKRVTYKITVTPPRTTNIIKGRRLRAKKALDVVTNDKKEIEERYETAVSERSTLEKEVNKLEKEIEEKKKTLAKTVREEEWLEKKNKIRSEQIKMLNQRLKKGWADEKSAPSDA